MRKKKKNQIGGNSAMNRSLIWKSEETVGGRTRVRGEIDRETWGGGGPIVGEL